MAGEWRNLPAIKGACLLLSTFNALAVVAGNITSRRANSACRWQSPITTNAVAYHEIGCIQARSFSYLVGEGESGIRP